MIVEHTLEIVSICPADGRPDVYRCIIRCDRLIQVEEILEAVEKYRTAKFFQEDLTGDLHRTLAVDVTTIGNHSGVRTVVRCSVGHREDGT